MAEADIVESCQNCRFWLPGWKFKKQQRFATGATALDSANPRNTSKLRSNSAKGLCRRYAPHTSALTAVWMETKNDDWCGDYDRTRNS